MPEFTLTGPNGQSFTLTGPEGATVEQAHEIAASFAERAAQTGAEPADIDDRTGQPESGYEHMLAKNQMIRMIARSLVGADPQGGEKGAYDILPPPEGPPGQLEKDAGIEQLYGPSSQELEAQQAQEARNVAAERLAAGAQSLRQQGPIELR
jgi:hypothetical protein